MWCIRLVSLNSNPTILRLNFIIVVVTFELLHEKDFEKRITYIIRSSQKKRRNISTIVILIFSSSRYLLERITKQYPCLMFQNLRSENTSIRNMKRAYI